MNRNEISQVIKDALNDLHKNETLERAIGRMVRNHRGSYEDYLDIMASIRDLARDKNITLLEAARRISET